MLNSWFWHVFTIFIYLFWMGTDLHNEDFEKSDEELASTRDSEDSTRSENVELELRAALAELS